MKRFNKRHVAPEYLRIPHLNKEISNMTHDDLMLETSIEFPVTYDVQEKVDGANMGTSFVDGIPILRNREHILKKGYMKTDTPAKKQFTSAWNWLHNHQKDIEYVARKCQSEITIYGDWLYAQHSIHYDKLPDLFIAYDIWCVDDDSYLSPTLVEELLSKTNIKYVKPHKVTFNSMAEIVEWSEKPSDFRTGIREGIVLKEGRGRLCNSMFKVVNSQFERRTDFNERLLRNKLA